MTSDGGLSNATSTCSTVSSSSVVTTVMARSTNPTCEETASRKDTEFYCAICSKHFASKGNLNKHWKGVHTDLPLATGVEETTQDQGAVCCLQEGCNFTCRYVSILREHLSSQHGIAMEFETKSFQSKKGLKLLAMYTVYRLTG